MCETPHISFRKFGRNFAWCWVMSRKDLSGLTSAETSIFKIARVFSWEICRPVLSITQPRQSIESSIKEHLSISILRPLWLSLPSTISKFRAYSKSFLPVITLSSRYAAEPSHPSTSYSVNSWKIPGPLETPYGSLLNWKNLLCLERRAQIFFIENDLGVRLF